MEGADTTPDHAVQHALLYKLITMVVISSTAPVAVAQDSDRQYLSEVLATTSKKNASYYRVNEGKEGELYIGKTYTLQGKLKAEGTYTDAGLTLEQGRFTYYHPNGKVESQGDYRLGKKSGIWFRFDQWGNPLAEKVYDPEPLANIIYTRAETMPQYRVGNERELVHYIKQKVTPESGVRLRGVINTSFIVEKDGALSEVKVVDGTSDAIDQQVVEAIKSTSPWRPGAERGQPVRVIMRVPVQF